MKNLKASIFKDMVQLNIRFLWLKHPEVGKNISFLTLPYAGITSINITYSIFKNIVKKVITKRSQSAGNSIIFSTESSETLRNDIVLKPVKLKFISEHVPTHKKPFNDSDFGYYLAGLIEGNGHFNNNQQLVIVFNFLDHSLAYYIKKKIGFGIIRKVKNDILLIIDSKKGLIKVINYINNKIRTENKKNQILINILNHKNYLEFNKSINLELDLTNNLNNYWLTGFADAKASFKLINNNIEVKLNFQINQKEKNISILIKYFLGGNIKWNVETEDYSYISDNFDSAKRIINYFDKFHLLSHKHVDFLKWRKVYCYLMEGKDIKFSKVKKIINN